MALTQKHNPQDDPDVWINSQMALEWADLVKDNVFPNDRRGLKAFIKMRGSKIGKPTKAAR